MNDGECEKYQGKLFVASAKLPDDDHVAYQGELVVARRSGEVTATGGPCPIIAIYDHKDGYGALMHISGEDAEIDGDSFEELIDQIFVIANDFPVSAKSFICLDKVPLAGFIDEENAGVQKEERLAYAQKIVDSLMDHGFTDIDVVSDKQEKYVALESTNGRVIVRDENDEVIIDEQFT